MTRVNLHTFAHSIDGDAQTNRQAMTLADESAVVVPVVRLVKPVKHVNLEFAESGDLTAGTATNVFQKPFDTCVSESANVIPQISQPIVLMVQTVV